MDLLDSKEKHKTVKEEENDDVDSSVLSAFRLRSSQIFSAALNAAIELNLFDFIAEEGGRHVSASEVACRLPSSCQHRDLASRIDRLLRLLASHSLLDCRVCEKKEEEKDGSTERLYALSSIGRQFVSGSLGFVPIFSHPALMQAWINFKDAIIDEDSDLFKKVHGMPMYQYAKTDPTWNKTFNKAMANFCSMEMKRILEIYEGFEGISTIVDVGGGTGQNLKMIVSKYPSIKGVNFDLPQVVQNAHSIPGIEHVGGDMFESVPEGDAMILKLAGVVAVEVTGGPEIPILILKRLYGQIMSDQAAVLATAGDSANVSNKNLACDPTAGDSTTAKKRKAMKQRSKVWDG